LKFLIELGFSISRIVNFKYSPGLISMDLNYYFTLFSHNGFHSHPPSIIMDYLFYNWSKLLLLFLFFFATLSCYNTYKCKTTLHLGLISFLKKITLKAWLQGLNRHLRGDLVFYLMSIIIEKTIFFWFHPLIFNWLGNRLCEWFFLLC